MDRWRESCGPKRGGVAVAPWGCWKAADAELLRLRALALDAHECGGIAGMFRLGLSEEVRISEIRAHGAETTKADRSPRTVRVLPLIKHSIAGKWHAARASTSSTRIGLPKAP